MPDLDHADAVLAAIARHLPPPLHELSHAAQYRYMVFLADHWRSLKRRNRPEAIEHLALAIGPDASHNNWRYMCTQIQDSETLAFVNELLFEHDRAVKSKRAIHHRAKPRGEEADAMRAIFQALVCFNPLMLSMSELYREIGGGQDTLAIQPIGPAMYVPPQQSTSNTERSRMRSKAGFLLPVVQWDGRGLIEVGNRDGRHWMPPISPDSGLDAYMVPDITAEQRCSPLYRFHAQAWALRGYAAMLERYNRKECPFLGEWPHHGLDLQRMRMHQDSGIRYLVEARRFYESRFELRRTRTARVIQLNMYADLYDEKRDKPKSLLRLTPGQRLPKSLYLQMAKEQARALIALLPYGGDSGKKDSVTMEQLREIIDNEARTQGLRFDTIPLIPPFADHREMRAVNEYLQPRERRSGYDPSSIAPPLTTDQLLADIDADEQRGPVDGEAYSMTVPDDLA